MNGLMMVNIVRVDSLCLSHFKRAELLFGNVMATYRGIRGFINLRIFTKKILKASEELKKQKWYEEINLGTKEHKI